MAPSRGRGTVFAADFRILDDKPLSEGGMGAVYRVEQLSTGKRRALKVMHAPLVADEKLRERFVQEARVGGRIESAHVVDVLSAGIDEATGMPWLAMELLDGVDLARRVEDTGALSRAEARELLEQLCHAVGAAHHAGIVHRDLKPENIFLSRSKEASSRSVVKVLDFGIAKIVAEAVTKRTGAMGTPLWMAPEQTETGTVDATADVWALGLIAFYVLTGLCFWKTGNSDEVSIPQIMREVLFEPIPLASARAVELGRGDRLPDGFDAWFARAVTREPSARFSDGTAAYEGIRGLLGDAPARTPLAATLMDTTIESAPITDPIPTRPRSPARPEELDRTVLATSTPPQPPRVTTSIHPPTPTPGPNELASRPRAPGRSPLVYVAPLLAALVIVGVVWALRVSSHVTHLTPPDAAVPEPSAVVLASAAPSAEEAPPVAPVAPLASVSSTPPAQARPASSSARSSSATDPLGLPRPDNGRLAEVLPSVENATLAITCFPPAKVSVDDKPAGILGRKHIHVPPGAHTVVFVTDEDKRRVFRVNVNAGDTKNIACNPHGKD